MPLWKWFLLNAYYHASKPARWWIRRKLAAQRRMPIAVLYYHRIADDGATEWTMPTQTFLDQMRWLRRNFELISLEETQRRMRGGVNDRPAVHVTFDDGYADNCRIAIPWLLQERVPCTYFVTVRNARERRPFDHDLKCGVDLAPNSLDEIRAIAKAGIEIGAHTYTHRDLGKLSDPTALNQELVVARQELGVAIGRPVRYFSFPIGLHANLSCQAFALAAQCGYEGVCSAYGGYNYPGDDPFHLQRIPAVCEILRLKNWLNADPRKIHVRRFEYRWNNDRIEFPPDRAGSEEAFHVISP
jgi:peptidoglycan/xylan/chitin deacetylase (PgdA/CDA1 family)